MEDKQLEGLVKDIRELKKEKHSKASFMKRILPCTAMASAIAAYGAYDIATNPNTVEMYKSNPILMGMLGGIALAVTGLGMMGAMELKDYVKTKKDLKKCYDLI